MTNILIRDVPDTVHAALQRKARKHQQSLQQYLSVQLAELARRKSVSDILDEVQAQSGGRVGLRVAVDDLATERVSR